jgi:hypothetical protein
MTQVNANAGAADPAKLAADAAAAKAAAANTPPTAESMVQQAVNSGQVPQKFLNDDGTPNIEKLTTAYKELERKQSGGTAPAAKADPAPATDTAATAAPADPQAQTFLDALINEGKEQAPAQGSIDWKAIETEINTTGALKPDTMKALTTAGVPETMIQAAVEGAKAKQKESFRKAAEIVGGEANLQGILKFVNASFDLTQKQQLLAALQGPQSEAVLLGLQVKMNKANGTQPLDTSLGGSAIAGANLQPFVNQEEASAAMRDPKYKTDPVYRANVAARIMVSRGASVTKATEKSKVLLSS